MPNAVARADKRTQWCLRIRGYAVQAGLKPATTIKNQPIMAKELFNSPRYGKKGFICQHSDPVILFVILLFFFTSLFVAIEEYISFKFNFSGAINVMLALVSTALGICFLFLFIEKKQYKQYLKILEDQKDLFHSNGKTPYVAPHEFGMSVSDTNYSLYLDLSLRLLSIIMKADKEEKVLEMDVVKTFIKKMNPSDFKKTLVKFNDYLKEDFAVEDVAFAMYWWFEIKDESQKDDDKRYYTLMQLFELAYSDGDFCEEEEYMLRYIAYHMRLTEAEYEKTLKRYIYKYQKNNYDEYYNQYMKARYKRVGGYWYRDRKGRKQWYSFKDDEQTGDYSSSSGNNNTTTPSISAELQKAYAVLGISVDATASEINACKRNLLRLNHPDLFSTRGQEAVSAATLKCQKINQAYELLRANGKC